MIGVIFYSDGAFLHCGLTDGTNLLDSYPGRGVELHPLPDKVGTVFWLPHQLGADAWAAAVARIGERFTGCAGFVCSCMGGQCILPTGLRRRLGAN